MTTIDCSKHVGVQMVLDHIELAAHGQEGVGTVLDAITLESDFQPDGLKKMVDNQRMMCHLYKCIVALSYMTYIQVDRLREMLGIEVE